MYPCIICRRETCEDSRACRRAILALLERSAYKPRLPERAIR